MIEGKEDESVTTKLPALCDGSQVKLPGSNNNNNNMLSTTTTTGTERSAEKNRLSTCAFADVVARASLEKWREIATSSGGVNNDNSSAEQTVVASVLALFDDTADGNKLEVLSLGTGTKFMRSVDIANDETAGLCVRDCHAEILARRSFLRLLVSEMQLVASGSPSRLVERWLDDERNDENVAANNCIRFRIKPSVSLHFYTSSSPCGNSTVRRWGSCPREKPWPGFDDPDALCWPAPPHEAIDISNRKQGQIAASVKNDIEKVSNMPLADHEFRVNPGKQVFSCFAIGTAEPNSGQGRVLSCSDKMALWNVLGVQGGVLSNVIGPVYLQTVTVGRKFSRKHLNRAICCRLQELPDAGVDDVTEASLFRVNHPATLCTSVKLNGGVITQTTKASFEEARCLAWSSSFEDGRAIEIDSQSGFESQTQQPAEICRQRLLESFKELWTACGDHATAAAAAWGRDRAKRLTKVGEDYHLRKLMALELMTNRKVPAFARKQKSRNKRKRAQIQL